MMTGKAGAIILDQEHFQSQKSVHLVTKIPKESWQFLKKRNIYHCRTSKILELKYTHLHAKKKANITSLQKTMEI